MEAQKAPEVATMRPNLPVVMEQSVRSQPRNVAMPKDVVQNEKQQIKKSFTYCTIKLGLNKLGYT